MIFLAEAVAANWMVAILFNVLIFAAVFGAVMIGARPLRQLVRRQEEYYESVLRDKLLIDVNPRSATVLTGIGIVVLGLIGYAVTGSDVGAIGGLAVGFVLPYAVLYYLRRKRLRRLEDQLVSGIQTISSSVRAGLNLVQAMEMVARDGPVPLRQEFTHLLREYEFGVPLDEAMANAAGRIGSSDFRLLFSALQTHRERGGDLGETLDRISASIREIQRLEKRVETLTAQGRTSARWLGAMPAAVLLILYFINSESVLSLFRDDLGKAILMVIVGLNVVGFLWIRKIVAIDI